MEIKEVEKQINRDIRAIKKSLIKRAKKGLYENFGQRELRDLESKYFDYIYKSEHVRRALTEFNNWALNFDLRSVRA